MPAVRPQKVVPRKTIRFKTVPVRSSKKVREIRANKKINVLQSERTALWHQNSHIAVALNNCKEEKAELFSQMNELKGEILRLQTELAGYRTKYEYVVARTPKSSPDFDAKLQSCLEGPRSILLQARDQADELRLSLNAALKSISNAGSTKLSPSHPRKKDCSSNDLHKRPVTLGNNRRSGSGSIAHIAPRVGGMEIRKPTICLTKMSVAELNNMAISLRDPDTVNPMIDQPEAQDGDEIPFIDEDGDLNDVETQQTNGIGHERFGRRRRAREYPSPTIEPLIEMDEDEVSDEELPAARLLRSRVSVDYSTMVQESQNQPRRDRRSSIVSGELPLLSTTSGRLSLDLQAPESRPSRASIARRVSSDIINTRVEASSSGSDAQRQSTSRGRSRSSLYRPDLRRRSTVTNGFPRYQGAQDSSSEDDSEPPIVTPPVEPLERSVEVNGSASPPPPPSNDLPNNHSENNTLNGDGSLLDPWYAIDPLEGPSWLFEDSGRAETMPIRAGVTKSHRENTSAASTSRTPSRLNPLREGSSESTITKPVSTHPRSATNSPQPRIVAKRSNLTGSLGSTLQLNDVHDEPDEQNHETEGRSRRRAATAAMSSLKEPSMNKKLRQGDPVSNSIYKDFVPNGKGKEKRKTPGRKQSK